MKLAQNWSNTAYNPSTSSENQIHSDEMAKKYGFKGGLVPGVTVSSYLMHPGVIAWGEDWLNHGYAKVKVHKPLYDSYQFDVEVQASLEDNASEEAYEASLRDQNGILCATGSFSLNKQAKAPAFRGDPVLEKDYQKPAATQAQMESLKNKAMFALPAKWSNKIDMASYLRDMTLMPEIHNFDGQALANGSFMLGLTNWVLAGNVYMNPWIHLETESQYFAKVENETKLIVECEIEDLFSKGGHEFVDVRVNAFTWDSKDCVMSAKLRAIYKVRT